MNARNFLNLLNTDGWKSFHQLLLITKEAVEQRMIKASKEENIYKLIGMLEGIKMILDIPERIKNEKEEQEKSQQTDLNKQFAAMNGGGIDAVGY